MSQFPPARILVVGRSSRQLDLLEGVLQRQGYDVYRAASGGRCLILPSIILPNLILLMAFRRMPGMDGWRCLATS
jgi:CheY-like chemotaxis protein